MEICHLAPDSTYVVSFESLAFVPSCVFLNPTLHMGQQAVAYGFFGGGGNWKVAESPDI